MMKAQEIMSALFAASHVVPLQRTFDVFMAGDPEKEIRKVAVTMMPTAQILRTVIDWGADFLVVHEPLYGEFNAPQGDPVYEAKAKLIADAGLTVCRYHDYCHLRSPDMIAAGEIHYLGFTGTIRSISFPVSRITLETPVTPRQMAARMTEKLGIAHPRIAGDADTPMSEISLCFGQTGRVWSELHDDGVEMVLAGELSEWLDSEYARDAAFFGRKKAVIAMGHVGSERDGMRLLCDEWTRLYPSLEVKYFDCGEVYTQI